MEQQAQSSCGPIVVLAVDSSQFSDFAFDYYVNQVHRPGYVLHLIHCSEGWTVHPMDGGPSPGHVHELKQKEEGLVTKMREKFTGLMAEKNISGEFHVLYSKHAWHEIVEYQKKVGGMMIVIGSRGLGVIRRTMMGSVSDSVVHHADCPVLVCRHH